MAAAARRCWPADDVVSNSQARDWRRQAHGAGRIVPGRSSGQTELVKLLESCDIHRSAPPQLTFNWLALDPQDARSRMLARVMAARGRASVIPGHKPRWMVRCRRPC